MTTNRFRVVTLLTALAGTIGFSALMRPDPIQAQAPAAAPAVVPAVAALPVGRYQVSAYSGSTADGLNPGCYVIDTATGKVWHTRVGAGVVEVTKQTIVVGR
jgi:hypothetical protein